MGQHNRPHPSQMFDLKIEQHGPNYWHPEGCIFFPAFPQPHNQALLPASVSRSSVDIPHMPDPYENAIYYGMPQYHGVQHYPHHHAPNLDLGVASTSNFCFPCATPPPNVAAGRGSYDQLPSSSNYGAVGVPADGYGTNGQLIDNSRSSYKRKNAEGNPGSFQHFNLTASSTSSVPLNMRHPDGVSTMDEVASSMSQHGLLGTDTRSVVEVGPHRIVRNRLGPDPILAHHQNHLIAGNYMGQPFQRTSIAWLDHQLNSGSSDASGSTWARTATFPYMHGNNMNINSMQTRNLALHQYHEQASNRSNSNFLLPSSVSIQQHNFRNPSPPIHGMRTHTSSFHPQAPTPTFGHPMGYPSQGTLTSSHGGFEVGLRHPRSVQPTGFRIYRPHRDGVVPNVSLRHHNLPHIRVLPHDEVAVLEFTNYYEMSNDPDHHRDMRLDIEHMSYEELLALGEWIGNVNTGVSEETIRTQLKTHIYLTSPAASLDEASRDQEPDSCIICQDHYKEGEHVGILHCRHQFHAECLKQWLRVKNICPICKSEAIAMQKKGI